MKGKWSVWKMKSDGRKAFAVYRLKDVEKKKTKRNREIIEIYREEWRAHLLAKAMNEQNEGKEEA